MNCTVYLIQHVFIAGPIECCIYVSLIAHFFSRSQQLQWALAVFHHHDMTIVLFICVLVLVLKVVLYVFIGCCFLGQPKEQMRVKVLVIGWEVSVS